MIVKLSELQKCFLSLQDMREKASFCMFFEKVRASKQKLEIDDPKPPKTGKVLSHYGEGSFYLTRNITLQLFR